MILISNSIFKEKIKKLTEGKQALTLENKLGFSKDLAEHIESVAGKLSIWLANAVINDTRKIIRMSEVMNMLNTHPAVKASITSKFASIKDWLVVSERQGNPINIKEYTSFLEAYEASREWHDSLVAKDEALFEFEGEVMYEYPENKGVIFYWEDLKTNDSPSEHERMGHCGRSPMSTTLYSLRSRRLIPETNEWASISHITVGINENNGITYQIKGKNNSRPKEEYHPYIVDLLILKKEIITGFGTEYNPKNDFKTTHLNTLLRNKLLKEVPQLFTNETTQLMIIVEKGNKEEITNFIYNNFDKLTKDYTSIIATLDLLKEKYDIDREDILKDKGEVKLDLSAHVVSLFFTESDTRGFVYNLTKYDLDEKEVGYDEVSFFKDYFIDIDNLIEKFILEMIDKYPNQFEYQLTDYTLEDIKKMSVSEIVDDEGLFYKVRGYFADINQSAYVKSCNRAYIDELENILESLDIFTKVDVPSDKPEVTVTVNLLYLYNLANEYGIEIDSADVYQTLTDLLEENPSELVNEDEKWRLFSHLELFNKWDSYFDPDINRIIELLSEIRNIILSTEL